MLGVRFYIKGTMVMRIRKSIIVLLVFLLSASLVFAQGAIEKKSNEKLIQVISLDKAEDGTYDITGLLENGSKIIYHVANDVEINFDVNAISNGMYLYVADNGIETASIPPQSSAVAIRNVTMGVTYGAIESSFDTAMPTPSLSEINLEDLFSRFSYSYGYITTSNYMQNGIYFDAGYYAKGVLDAWKYGEVEPFFSMEDMYNFIQEFITAYQNGEDLSNEVGEVYTSEDEISALVSPNTLKAQFSYSYGYLIMLDMLFQGYNIVAPDFATGALYALYEATPLLNDSEMEQALVEYNEYLSNLYNEYVAELVKTNLEEANSLLEENAKKDGVIVLDSGVQISILTQDGDSGVMPTKDDSVVVDYTLELPDGTIVDQGEDVTFELANLIPGFTEAVTNMHVGDTILAYIPPELGYGETGAGDVIEPNKLLIYTIYLDSIVEK